MTTWHYLPVFTEERDERVYGLCEVHIGADDRVQSWTKSMFMYPSGNDLSDMSGELGYMLLDCRRWEPIAFGDLKPGLELKRAMPKAEADALKATLKTLAKVG